MPAERTFGRLRAGSIWLKFVSGTAIPKYSDQCPSLTSRTSRTSHAVSRASSFSWAVPRTRSVLKSPLCVRGDRMVAPGQLPLLWSPDSTCGPSSPLVDHFELDAFGLDGPSEATVVAVDAELELLLELCRGKEGERRGGWGQVMVSWAFCGEGRWGTASCQGSPGESVFLITLVLSF